MIQNILFPVDFSPACAAMAPLVNRAAAIFSARVTLLHALEVSVSGIELVARSLREAEEDLKLVAQGKLNSFLPAEFPPEISPRFLVTGSAANWIATEQAFDLIAMPTHAGVFWRMLLGSTTARVLNDPDCPVLTTQHAETSAPRPLEHREWVCAISLQEDSKRVLRFVAGAAETVHANLTLIPVIPASEPGLPVQLELRKGAQSAERRAARRRIEELQKAVGSHARTYIVVGPMKDSLTEAARRLRADVLVIGRGP